MKIWNTRSIRYKQLNVTHVWLRFSYKTTIKDNASYYVNGPQRNVRQISQITQESQVYFLAYFIEPKDI
jgi:DNA-binding beta-propeller fold protein YncE